MEAPMLMDDRISQLPHPILHHILRYLPQEEAVRTCLLSKSWRYLGPTRPNFTMGETDFNGSKQEFINVLERYLQLYHDYKICPQEFFLSMSIPDSESVLFLDKWIPVLVRDWAVEAFSLSFLTHYPELFDLPSVVFESKSLQYLDLRSCNLSRVNCLDKDILSVNLKKLCLSHVIITDEILEKIICSCPLIELNISFCKGLRVIRVDKRACFLKRFCLHGPVSYDSGSSVEIDVPSLEKIVVSACWNSYHDMNTYFPLLKSLRLFAVGLSRESFCLFSRNFPCLESLSFNHCYGFEEFELCCRSVKELEIKVQKQLNRAALNSAAIDVPCIVMFKYDGHAPESFSFTTNSKKWKSDITLQRHDFNYETSPRLGKVDQLLRAVSGSEISLDISKFSLYSHSLSSFMENLFCICRPRIIRLLDFSSAYELKHNETTKYMCMFLGMDKGGFVSGQIRMGGHHWRQDLEKVTVETFDENGEKWHPIIERSWSEFWEALLGGILPKDWNRVKRRQIRFRLTWRE